MKYLLDTNVCIHLLRGSSIILREKILKVDDEDICFPSIVRFELYYGAYKSAGQQKVLSALNSFLSRFKSAQVDDDIAEQCGRIRFELDMKGTPIGPYDLIIAGTALSRKLILVTHNTREFSRINHLNLEDWELAGT